MGLEHFTDEAGSEAAGNAVAAIDGARVESGDYTVVFGPQPVADLCNKRGRTITTTGTRPSPKLRL